MICGACKSEVKPSKFCSSCGAALTTGAPVHVGDFSLEWAAEIFRAAGYTVTEIVGEAANKRCTAAKPGSPSLMLYYRPEARLLILQMSFNIPAPSFLATADHLKAANALNAETLLFKCWFTADKYEMLHCQFGFFVAEVVCPVDLLFFNELVLSLVRNAFSRSAAERFKAKKVPP
jgi:hypothetical protein